MKKKKKKNFILGIIKKARSDSRKEEIEKYGKMINQTKIVPSKKIYARHKLPKEI
ncbi:MAG: hypothetical protein LBV75_07740 [Paludibacter sp.]|jgi:uncharacterized protein YdeI (YjbR/CyaY-like superfamily)|nr:hypothetical protein [Paludibacter sp.]